MPPYSSKARPGHPVRRQSVVLITVLTGQSIPVTESGYESCNGFRGGAIAHGQDGLTIRH